MCDCKNKVTIGFKKTSPLAQVPAFATNGSAGMDIRSIEQVSIEPGDFSIISTGLIPSIPEGYEIQVRPRSGLAAKKGITVLNTPGTIDSDYTGVIGVIVINHGKSTFEINIGDRIAQLVVSKLPTVNVIEVETINETLRGVGGFGSTGVS